VTRRWTFLATFIVGLIGTAAVTFILPDVYRTTAFLFVGTDNPATTDYEASQTNQVLLKTYAELMQSPNTEDAVAEELPYPTSGRDLGGSIDVSPISQSQLIAITAEARTPARAKLLADTYATVFVRRLEQRSEIGAGRVRITVAEPAALPLTPAEPRPRLYLLVGALLSVLLAIGAAIVRQRLDQRLEVGVEATEVFGLPILGRIPRNSASLQSLSRRSPPMPLAEASRVLLANVAFANLGKRPGSLAVVSPDDAEGKSTCALSLAIAATELGIEVGLVDADLRRPRLSAAMNYRPGTRPGLSDFLLAPDELSWNKESLRAYGSPLYLIPSGSLPPNPPALLGTGGLMEFERRARSIFDLVVFDTPPLLIGVDAALISAAAEGVILVLDVAKTKRNAASQAVDQLRQAHANVMGVVLNRVPLERGPYDYVEKDSRPGSTRDRSLAARGGPRQAPAQE
jgi:tyrosine-protein kinase